MSLSTTFFIWKVQKIWEIFCFVEKLFLLWFWKTIINSSWHFLRIFGSNGFALILFSNDNCWKRLCQLRFDWKIRPKLQSVLHLFGGWWHSIFCHKNFSTNFLPAKLKLPNFLQKKQMVICGHSRFWNSCVSYPGEVTSKVRKNS